MQFPFFILRCLMETLTDILLDTLIDNIKLFPFLLITYLFLEYMEHRTSEKAINLIRKAGYGGPLIGALCGALPQCGFSAAAGNLFAARVVSLGTLMAIFLSTSDEMLPIMIADAAEPKLITALLLYKIGCGLVFGYMIDFVWRKYTPQPAFNMEELCSNENCHCEDGIWRPALHHSVRIALFIFAVTLILNAIFAYIHPARLSAYLQTPILGELGSGLFGLMPNCSASVILTQLYLENCINISTLLSGSLVNAGVGLLILFRVNRHLKQNLRILALLYICGVAGGLFSRLVF